jgi:hypothetical protein
MAMNSKKNIENVAIVDVSLSPTSPPPHFYYCNMKIEAPPLNRQAAKSANTLSKSSLKPESTKSPLLPAWRLRRSTTPTKHLLLTRYRIRML